MHTSQLPLRLLLSGHDARQIIRRSGSTAGEKWGAQDGTLSSQDTLRSPSGGTDYVDEGQGDLKVDAIRLARWRE